MDGKVFAMKDFNPGVTAPPFHCWCRSCTVPYFDDEFNIGKRAARGEDGKTYYVPDDMKYSDWKESFVVDSISIKDKTEFANYQSILGKNAPNSLEDFMNMKYNSDNEWMQYKAYASSIKSGELTSLVNFDLYKNISKEMDDKIVGILTSTGVRTTGKSNHSIARVIGSVEQRRNGVSVEDALNALTSQKSEVLPIKTLTNGKSQKFRNETVEVSINPNTGNIIQVNPVHAGKKVKS